MFDREPSEIRRDTRRRAQAHADTLRRALLSTPGIEPPTLAPSQRLPALRSPSLAGLRVTVELPREADQVALLRDFRRLQRAHATRRERARGEEVALHDELVVDFLTYFQGEPVPYENKERVRVVVDDLIEEHGFASALVGTCVGEAVLVDDVTRADHPVKSLRSVRVRRAVCIRDATAVLLPDEDDEVFLRATGLGATLAEVARGLVGGQISARARDLFAVVVRRTLREVWGRTGVRVPESLVDAVIRDRWLRDEGTFVKRQGLSHDAQAALVRAWLTSADERARTRDAIAATAVLDAVARDLPPTSTEAERDVVRAVADVLGLSRADITRALESDPQLYERVHAHEQRWRALQHIVDQTDVVAEEAPPRAEPASAPAIG